jgi:hypothetical protein
MVSDLTSKLIHVAASLPESSLKLAGSSSLTMFTNRTSQPTSYSTTNNMSTHYDESRNENVAMKNIGGQPKGATRDIR